MIVRAFISSHFPFLEGRDDMNNRVVEFKSWKEVRENGIRNL
ncbi:MAG: hypothetical protein DDT22_01305 [candidate division WS2 bacterium]|nr:hypothetical protein [Candidatus Lithacetigena glycinireducens]